MGFYVPNYIYKTSKDFREYLRQLAKECKRQHNVSQTAISVAKRQISKGRKKAVFESDKEILEIGQREFLKCKALTI